jgi:Zn finger protein HypA/HybF involved in hydrogenase expression
MHEYPIARDLVNQAIVETIQQTAQQITALNIIVGS